MVSKIFTSALTWQESWLTREAARNNYFSVPGCKGGITWGITSRFLTGVSLYPSSLNNDKVGFWGEGKQKLVLEATFPPEITPHLQEGCMRNSYAIPALSIKEASDSLGLSHSPQYFICSHFKSESGKKKELNFHNRTFGGTIHTEIKVWYSLKCTSDRGFRFILLNNFVSFWYVQLQKD